MKKYNVLGTIKNRKKWKTKYSPKLSFYADYSFSQADKINDLINVK